MTSKPGTPERPEDVNWDAQSSQPLLGSDDDLIPFNPLDTQNLAIAVAKALLERRARPLGRLGDFRGAGIYCIYYRGGFPPYRVIATENRDLDFPRWPIYVGKAVPAGGRRGSFSLGVTDTNALNNRLAEHGDSIRRASNLDIGDFSCRFLIVHDLWIPLAEALLITHFAPVWNKLIDGFGNHNPGKGRYEGVRPRWDVLHPGRPWAERCKPRPETKEEIEREIVTYLSGLSVPSLAVLRGDLSGE